MVISIDLMQMLSESLVQRMQEGAGNGAGRDRTQNDGVPVEHYNQCVGTPNS